MKKIGLKIKAYFLLTVFLTVSFPVQEFFHEHQNPLVCTDSHHSNEKNHKKVEKCTHKAHFSQKLDKHFCFFVHISKNFIVYTFNTIYFDVNFLNDFLQIIVQKFYLEYVKSYFLRGPPFIS